jgi:peptide-methionine (R)-S-oxide reductase
MLRISIMMWVAFATATAWGLSASDDKPAGQSSTASEKRDASPASPRSDDEEKSDKVVRSEKEWRKILTKEQFRVLRMKGTERPFANKFDRHFAAGTYACAACGQELFASDTKFNSGCGWPAFYAAKAGDRVVMTQDLSQGMVRTEVTCARCGSHLGHIFDDAPQTPTGQRFCINSVSLKFIPADSQKEVPDEKSSDADTRDRPKQDKSDKPEKQKAAQKSSEGS